MEIVNVLTGEPRLWIREVESRAYIGLWMIFLTPFDAKMGPIRVNYNMETDDWNSSRVQNNDYVLK